MATKGGCGIRAQRKRASRKWKGSVQRAFNCVVIGSQRRIYLDSQGLLGVQRTNRKSTKIRKRNQTLIVNRRLIISCPFPWSKSWMLAWHFTFYFKLKKKNVHSSLLISLCDSRGHPKPRVRSLKTFSWQTPQNDLTDTGRASACTRELTSDSQAAPQLLRWGTEDAANPAEVSLAQHSLYFKTTKGRVLK